MPVSPYVMKVHPTLGYPAKNRQTWNKTLPQATYRKRDNSYLDV